MKISNKLAIFLASFAVSLLLLSNGLSYAAGSASFSLSPASATENIGTTFPLTVYENGNGNPVNVVTANLSYNSSILQFVGAACGGAFSNTVSANGGGGSVSLSCYTAPGATAPSDNEAVGTVSFKALAGSGSANISFASGSIIASNGSNVWNGSAAGGTYNLATPASAPQPSTPAKGGGSADSSSGSTTSKGGGSSSSSPTSSGSTSKKNGSSPVRTSTNPTNTSTSSNTKPGNNKQNNQRSHSIHGRLVSNTTGLSAAAYWAIGIVSLAIIAAVLVFRKKLLNTVKVATTKYSFGRRA